MIKIGYELPYYRGLIYELQSENIYAKWVVQRWDIYNKSYSIPELFYNFDCACFLEDVGYKRFISLLDLSEYIESDLKTSFQNNTNEITNNHNNCNNDECCTVINEIQKLINKKTELKIRIEEFNTNKELNEPLSILNIILFPDIKLKALGDYICKEKNYNELIKFTETFDFVNFDIILKYILSISFKMYLKSFVLSGESQSSS